MADDEPPSFFITGKAERDALLKSGVPEKYLSHVIATRRRVRCKMRKQANNARYYQRTKEKRVQKAQESNARRRKAYIELNDEEKKIVQEQHRYSQQGYRRRNKDLLAQKERERRARHKQERFTSALSDTNSGAWDNSSAKMIDRPQTNDGEIVEYPRPWLIGEEIGEGESWEWVKTGEEPKYYERYVV
ncbi:hypothetical protein VKT23_019735 [Stygiomarasmius scandens]|uniref:BZIP domain-containing protein n=1 Tax=Marasmiellus scandens TaxID=2682957 RepID=A0ABR1IPT3_9AGAR